jgi:hypothetical protein
MHQTTRCSPVHSHRSERRRILFNIRYRDARDSLPVAETEDDNARRARRCDMPVHSGRHCARVLGRSVRDNEPDPARTNKRAVPFNRTPEDLAQQSMQRGGI